MMAYRSAFKMRFARTPVVLRRLIKALGLVALGAWAISWLFAPWLGPWAPQALLALTSDGIDHLYLWQILSYLFVLPGPLSFGSLLHLIFSLYLIWVAGEAIWARVGSRGLVKLSLVSGLTGGLAGWGVLLLLPGYHVVAGAMALGYGLLTGWAMHSPSHRLAPLLLAPLELRWVACLLFGYSLLSNLSAQQYAVVATYGGAILGAYFFALLAWNLPGPFAITRRFDQGVARLGVRVRAWRPRKAKKKGEGRVFDLKSGRVVEEKPQDLQAQLRRQRLQAWQANRAHSSPSEGE
jgi:membrane associated rhomboid family serine protease